MSAVIESRLNELKNGGVLAHGSHSSFESGACAMEWVSYLAGEGHTDAPQCASPLLRRFTIHLNDSWDMERRQNLAPFLPRMVGTRDDGQDSARSYLALDWLIRTYTPAWLDLAGLPTHAQELRSLRRIADADAVAEVSPTICAAKDAARASAGPFRGLTAENVAKSAAGYAAWYAAGNAAQDSAGYTALYAAWDGAGYVAEKVVRSVYHPTFDTLQASALELLDRMIDPSKEQS